MPDTNWLAAQAWLFGAAVLAGVIIGMGYHLYHAALKTRGRGPWRRYVASDALFGAVAILFIVCYWLLVTDGSLYPSDFVWMAGGFILYRLTMLPVIDSARRRLLTRRSISKKPVKETKKRPAPKKTPQDKLPTLQSASLRLNLYFIRSALAAGRLVKDSATKVRTKLTRKDNEQADGEPPDEEPPGVGE